MSQTPINLWVMGLSHRTAPVEVRETLALDAHALPEACKRLSAMEEVEECLVLSTCNRSEAVAVLRDGVSGADVLHRFWSSIAVGGRSPSAEHYFTLHGRDSLRHLFRVAASLDSMVVGEPQILGQLKQSYGVAKGIGALHGALDMLTTRSFQVAKRVRTETGIGENAVSISFAAVELARRIFGQLRGKRVLILGAGKMSELAARHLRQAGAEHIFVTNRTYHRAVEIASVFHGVSIRYEEMEKRLPEMDIIITSSAAPHYVITEALMKRVMEVRRHKPTFLIDIAVPRNVEPSVHSLDQVFLYDIDDLQKVVEDNLKEREARADRAEEIVREEVEKAVGRLRAREAGPTIARLQDRLEQIRQSEMERLRRKLGPVSREQEEAIEYLTRSIVAKIAHGPIAEIRRSAVQSEGVEVLDAMRRAFALDERGSDVEAPTAAELPTVKPKLGAFSEPGDTMEAAPLPDHHEVEH